MKGKSIYYLVTSRKENPAIIFAGTNRNGLEQVKAGNELGNESLDLVVVTRAEGEQLLGKDMFKSMLNHYFKDVIDFYNKYPLT